MRAVPLNSSKSFGPHTAVGCKCMGEMLLITRQCNIQAEASPGAGEDGVPAPFSFKRGLEVQPPAPVLKEAVAGS